MKIEVHIVKAFTKNPDEGNPVGIVFNAEHLAPEQMMAIVEKTGFAECAFVQKSNIATIKVRFFSPKKEMNLCGHATIGLFHILKCDADLDILTQETLAGVLKVIKQANGLLQMQQAEPIFYEQEYDIDMIAAQLLNIRPEEIINKPIRVSTGTPKLLVQLKNIETLWGLKPNFDAIKELVPTGIYTFVKKSEDFFYARQFNPSTGINEDPVTGIAAGALGAYLKKYHNINNQFIVEQGHVLKKTGQLYVNANNEITVGGYAVECGQIILYI